MARSGPRKVFRYCIEFKLAAVRLSNAPGVRVQTVATALDIHPFTLSKWRREARKQTLRGPGRPAPAPPPARELRRWYQHTPAKWPEFRRQYFAELDANPAGVAELRAHLGRGVVTLVFGSREERLNNATAMRDYLSAHH